MLQETNATPETMTQETNATETPKPRRSNHKKEVEQLRAQLRRTLGNEALLTLQADLKSVRDILLDATNAYYQAHESGIHFSPPEDEANNYRQHQEATNTVSDWITTIAQLMTKGVR